MSKKMGDLFVIMGAVSIFAALSLFLYNKQESAQAGREAAFVLDDLVTVLGEECSTTNSSGIAGRKKPGEALSPEMPVVMIGEYEYVGYLHIPTLEIRLPVMADWDYEKLRIAPCREFGSSRTDDLVIAAHNYESHFGDLEGLKAGEPITFTDMEGVFNAYIVAEMKILGPTMVEEVHNSGHDLVLYTCTKGGSTRAVVFCDRSEG